METAAATTVEMKRIFEGCRLKCFGVTVATVL
jgi:hypothetical protein